MKNDLTGAFAQSKDAEMSLGDYSNKLLDQFSDVINIFNPDNGEKNINDQVISRFSNLLSMGYVSRDNEENILSMQETNDQIQSMLKDITKDQSLDLRNAEDRMVLTEKVFGELNTNENFAFDQKQLTDCINISRAIDKSQGKNDLYDIDSNSNRPVFNQQLSSEMDSIFPHNSTLDIELDALVKNSNDKTSLTMELYSKYGPEDKEWPSYKENEEIGTKNKDLAGKQMDLVSKTSSAIDLFGKNESEESRKFLMGMGIANVMNNSFDKNLDHDELVDNIGYNLKEFMNDTESDNPFSNTISIDDMNINDAIDGALREGNGKDIDRGKTITDIYSSLNKQGLTEDMKINLSNQVTYSPAMNINDQTIAEYSDLLSMGFISKDKEGEILSSEKTSDRINSMLHGIAEENSLDLSDNGDRMTLISKAMGELKTNPDFAFDQDKLADCINISRAIDESQRVNDFSDSYRFNESESPVFNQKLNDRMENIFPSASDEINEHQLSALIDKSESKNSLAVKLYDAYSSVGEEKEWPEKEEPNAKYEIGNSGKELIENQMDFTSLTGGSVDLSGLNGSEESRKFLFGLGFANIVHDGMNSGLDNDERQENIENNMDDFMIRLSEGNPDGNVSTGISTEFKETLENGLQNGVSQGKLTRNLYSAMDQDTLEEDMKIDLSKDLYDVGHIQYPNEKILTDYSNVLSMAYACEKDNGDIMTLDETAAKIKPMLRDITSENNLDLTKEDDRIQLAEKALGELNASKEFTFSEDRMTSCINISRAIDEAKQPNDREYDTDRPVFNQKLGENLGSLYNNIDASEPELDAIVSMENDPTKLTMKLYSEFGLSDEENKWMEPDEPFKQNQYGIGVDDKTSIGKDLGFAAQSMGTADLLGKNGNADTRKMLMGLGISHAVNNGIDMGSDISEKMEAVQSNISEMLSDINDKSPNWDKYNKELPEEDFMKNIYYNGSRNDMANSVYSELNKQGFLSSDLKVNTQDMSTQDNTKNPKMNEQMVSRYADTLSMAYMTQNADGIDTLDQTSKKITPVLNNIVKENGLDLNKVEDRMTLMDKAVDKLNTSPDFAYNGERLAKCINVSRAVDDAQTPDEYDSFDQDSTRAKFNQKLSNEISTTLPDADRLDEQRIDAVISKNQDPTKLTMALYSEYEIENEEWPDEQLLTGKESANRMGFPGLTAGLADLSGNDGAASRQVLFGLGFSNAVNEGLNFDGDQSEKQSAISEKVSDLLENINYGSPNEDRFTVENNESMSIIDETMETMKKSASPETMTSKLYCALESNECIPSDIKIDMSKDLYDKYTDLQNNPNEKLISEYSNLLSMGYEGHNSNGDPISMEETAASIKPVLRDIVRDNNLDLGKEADRKIFADKALNDLNLGDKYTFSNSRLETCINISRAIDEAQQPNAEMSIDTDIDRPKFNQQFEQLLDPVLPGGIDDEKQFDNLIKEYGNDPTKLTMAIYSAYGDGNAHDWPELDSEEMHYGSKEMGLVSQTIASTDLLNGNSTEASRQVLSSIGMNEAVRHGMEYGYDGESRSESIKDNVQDLFSNINYNQPNQEKYNSDFSDNLNEKLNEIVPEEVGHSRKINPGRFANEMCSKLNEKDIMPDDLKVNTNKNRTQSQDRATSFAEVWGKVKDNMKETMNEAREKYAGKSGQNMDR